LKSLTNAKLSLATTLLYVNGFCVDMPMSAEDRNPTTETGTGRDYSTLNMTSLNANISYNSVQPGTRDINKTRFSRPRTRPKPRPRTT